MIYFTAEFFTSLSFFGSAENYFTAGFFTSLSFFGSAENILRAILETCYTATGQRKKPPHAIVSHLCLAIAEFLSATAKHGLHRRGSTIGSLMYSSLDRMSALGSTAGCGQRREAASCHR